MESFVLACLRTTQALQKLELRRGRLVTLGVARMLGRTGALERNSLLTLDIPTRTDSQRSGVNYYSACYYLSKTNRAIQTIMIMINQKNKVDWFFSSVLLPRSNIDSATTKNENDVANATINIMASNALLTYSKEGREATTKAIIAVKTARSSTVCVLFESMPSKSGLIFSNTRIDDSSWSTSILFCWNSSK